MPSSGIAALSPETVVVRSAEPLTAPVDGELVLLDPASSRYFGLDRIGHRIWNLIEAPRSIEQVCSTLQAEFEVEPEACRADVLVFLDRLHEAKLVEVR